jgi:hypothetical protein
MQILGFTGDSPMHRIGRLGRSVALGFAAVVAMWPGAVRAEVLFTFDVPVELNNLHPDFRQGRIWCNAVRFPADAIRTGRLAGSENITNGGGSAIFAIASGRYSGSQAIVLDDTFVLPGRRAADANGYSCYITLNNGRDWLEPINIPRWGPPAAGTTPQLNVNGLFAGAR